MASVVNVLCRESVAGFRAESMLPVKPPSDDALHDQVVGRASHTDTHAEVEFPLRPEVHVNGREELLLLLAQTVEPGQRTIGGVIFQPARDSLGEIETEIRFR